MKNALAYFFLLFGIAAMAQNGYVKGYVITNKGDTIRGKIKDRKYVKEATSWQKIKFVDTLCRKYSFDPEEIKEYVRYGKPRYKTLVLGVESKKTFVEVTEDGPVILYSYYRGTWGGAGNAIVINPDPKKSQPKLGFYITYMGMQVTPVFTGETKELAECFLQFKDKPNSLMQWRPRDYGATARVFFGDNAEILKLIEEGTLDENDIYVIVKKYNASKK